MKGENMINALIIIFLYPVYIVMVVIDKILTPKCKVCRKPLVRTGYRDDPYWCRNCFDNQLKVSEFIKETLR